MKTISTPRAVIRSPRAALTPVPRGVIAAQAAMTPQDHSPLALVQSIQASVEEIRNAHAARIEAIERSIDEHSTQAAALRIGGSHSGGLGTISGEDRDVFHAQLLGRVTAAMSTNSDPGGGYTVPNSVDGMIGTLLRDLSPLRGLARIVQQEPGTGSWQKIVTATGSGTAWAGETEDRDETDAPVLGIITIDPHEIYAIPSLTNHVLEDSSFDLNAFVQTDVAGEFSLGEGHAFVLGDGVKKPRGFTTYDVSTAADASRAFGSLQYIATGNAGAFPASNPGDVLYNLLASLRPIYRKGDGVAWLMNSATANVIRKFKDGQGNYLWTNGVTLGQPDSLLGYPVELDESMPDIGANNFAVAFGNWRRGYAIVDKRGVSVIVDRVTKKGWTKLYFSRRVGGGVIDFNAIKLLKFAAS